jgi:hypothetical protein
MIVKVKEPQAGERAMLREGQILYTYLHLAPDPAQCADLVSSGAVCIAYETVTQAGGGLPLLAPMSEVAGRLSVQAGAYCLEKAHGGMGVLLGGVAGVPSAKIVILGGGVVGSNAAQIAVGSGAQVVVIDRNIDVLRRMDRLLGARVITVFSNRDNVEQHVLRADLVIGGVLIPRCCGAQAGHPPDGRRDEAGFGDRRRRHRPGRLLRDGQGDDACRSDLPGRQRRALLRRQHAGRRAAHLDLRAQQCDPAVRAADRRQGLAAGAAGRRTSAQKWSLNVAFMARSPAARSPKTSQLRPAAITTRCR